MTPVEFAEGPAQNPLLTQEQKFAILMNISSKKAGLPMPEKFSNDTKHRNYQIKHKTSFYLCKPDLVKDKPVKSIGMIETYLIFSCHRDLKIYGVQVSQVTVNAYYLLINEIYFVLTSVFNNSILMCLTGQLRSSIGFRHVTKKTILFNIHLIV